MIPQGLQAEAETLSALENARGSDKGPALTGSFNWESRYVAEGRDYLEGDGLLSLSTETAWKDFGFTTWYGAGIDNGYGEWNLSPTYQHTLGNTSITLAYHHLFFTQEDEDSSEIGFTLSQSGLPLGLNVEFNGYRSLKTQGYFSNLSTHREWQVTENLSIYPGAEIGFHSDYIQQAHNGANHTSAFLVLEWEFRESCTLTSYAAYNWSMGKQNQFSRPGDAFLGNFFWSGMGLQLTF